MHLSVKGKQLDVGDALRTHVDESLTAIVGKYFGRPIEANVVFSREAHLFKADISVHVGRNILLQSNAEASEPYPAFDTAADKIAKRLRRYKRRLKDHHKHDGDGVDGAMAMAPLSANQYILEAEADETHIDGYDDETLDTAAPLANGDDGHPQPVVIAEMTTAIDTLTVSEAVMRMDLAELPALMFRNRAHGGLNMIYRRHDGNVGWIDPTGTEGAGA
ncbi:ribose ABC transporter permease [Skermanella stibiiresistens SB22]|jgi:ribosomal subunit interface protein|uniref:Ribosome hibernation promoting factor n=1 Tax=Skermanella stibiiresistens SB22 TaxID=1385369 RepID=W9H017_9PROT|nr:ribosome-associated translation inhibitor RaiA [Skermanella stibiiresistens]EWY38057.1 ribose ABC transporter permease [Skermanella stibiiresistens SB22]